MGGMSGNTATLEFNFAAAGSTNRQWEIKATQIPCGADTEAPNGCLQYHSTLTGRIQTFNFANSAMPQHLANQE